MSAPDADRPAPRVKICGLTDPSDLQLAADAGADAVGVISDVPVDTPREVAPDLAAELVAATPPFVTSVLVTMAETAAPVLELVGTINPDAVQLHGGLPPRELEAVADATTTIAAYDIDEEVAIRDAAEVADVILVDSTDDAGGGGTGRTHDWERASTLVEELDTPLILAGGLDPDNVAAAVEAVRPYGVDVATGVATTDDPARKEPTAVRRFVRRARGFREVTEPWSQ